jgi:hypothetical protein
MDQMMPATPRRQRLAIVLFNLGGPDAPESVRPFLVNLFTDPAILRVPGFIRPWLGKLCRAGWAFALAGIDGRTGEQP